MGLQDACRFGGIHGNIKDLGHGRPFETIRPVGFPLVTAIYVRLPHLRGGVSQTGVYPRDGAVKPAADFGDISGRGVGALPAPGSWIINTVRIAIF